MPTAFFMGVRGGEFLGREPLLELGSGAGYRLRR